MTAKEFYNRIDQASSNGRFFGCKFIKKDGTVRTMNARRGVKKHLKPGGKPRNYSPAQHHNLIVWDRNAKGYRTINTDRLIYFKQGKIKIER